MDTAKLISKNLIQIPKHLQKSHAWELGLEFVVVDTADGLLLQPQPKPIYHPHLTPITLEQVAGSLAYTGPAKSIEEMDLAIKQAIEEQWHDFS